MANVSTDVTLNENIAFGIEFRPRSAYYWRKAVTSNFTPDVTKSIAELRDSPLSDERNTLLTRSFLRLSPKWDFKVTTKTGWGRSNEPAYNSMAFELDTLLTCSWKWHVSYERMPHENRFSNSLSLVK